MAEVEMVVLRCSIFAFMMIAILSPASAEQCGTQADGALCPDGLCCSNYGWCGNTPAYCSPDNCQSQCPDEPTPTPPPPTPPTPPTPAGEGVASIITEDVFNEMLKHRNDSDCPAMNCYVYNAFIAAANAFEGFGTTGNETTRKRELAAFFGQTSHETTGGWATAPDGPYAWGYCFIREIAGGDYCANTELYPCASGQQYYGRGPIQLSWNFNYIQAGNAIGFDGLNNPDIVARDATISFQTAIWFWMTAQPPKPSCHDVITGTWNPSENDVAAGREAGYGLTTNIINGGLECGQGRITDQEASRIGFYKRYCDMLGVSYGDNLSCQNQAHYGLALPMTAEQAQIIVY